MKTISDYCDICFETHQIESQKIADVLIPIVQRQKYALVGEQLKPFTIKKEMFTAFNMAYISMIMIVEGVY